MEKTKNNSLNSHIENVTFILLLELIANKEEEDKKYKR